jgi:hypothetical protein
VVPVVDAVLDPPPPPQAVNEKTSKADKLAAIKVRSFMCILGGLWGVEKMVGLLDV